MNMQLSSVFGRCFRYAAFMDKESMANRNHKLFEELKVWVFLVE